MNTVTSRIPVAVGSASGTPRPAGFKVDISRGERIGRVSSEWFSRPDDERYLSLSDLYASVCSRTERGRGRVARPFGFALTDPGRRLSRTRLFPEVTRVMPRVVSRDV